MAGGRPWREGARGGGPGGASERHGAVRARWRWQLLADGFPAAQLSNQMLEALLAPGGEFASLQKAKIALQLAEVDKALVDGADEYLQLINLLSFTMRALK